MEKPKIKMQNDGLKFKNKGIIARYKDFLPVSEKTPIISLNEGNTPLISAPYLSEIIGIDVFLKYEGLNPTGSFKDRGMTLAVSKAVEEGYKAVICASTGNTSASAAAYAARAKIRCIVVIPEGAIALGKLSQALIHGAQVIAIKGNFDTALSIVREIIKKQPIALVNSLNPYRIEGQKSAAFEICDALHKAPVYQAIPVGNAGNITAYWKGYKEYKAKGKIKSLPKMLGFQAEGSAPIVQGHPIKNPQTIATAIRIGNPASWEKAERARDESDGLIESVRDEEILFAYKLLAEKEGIFVEPASAASVAGIIKLSKTGYFKTRNPFPPPTPRLRRAGATRNSQVVCILTGHGLKDPDRAIQSVEKPKIVEASVKTVMGEISRTS